MIRSFAVSLVLLDDSILLASRRVSTRSFSRSRAFVRSWSRSSAAAECIRTRPKMSSRALRRCRVSSWTSFWTMARYCLHVFSSVGVAPSDDRHTLSSAKTLANHGQFCSGLQRRRHSWPKSSALLSLLLVINITVLRSLIVRGSGIRSFIGSFS